MPRSDERKPSEEEPEPDGDVRDVRKRDEEEAPGFQERPEEGQREARVGKVLEDVSGDDDVEGLPPRPGEPRDDVLDERIVEEGRPFPGGVGVELDSGEVAAAGADPAREMPGAEADVEHGQALRRAR